VQFEVEAAIASVVELRVPHRGTIRQLILDEAGAAGAATFQLFSARKAAYAVSDDPSISSESSDVAGQEPAVHSIMGVKDVAGGRFADYEMDTMYRNGDGTSTNPERRLWMVITPAGSGTKLYALSMVIEMPSLMA
jgi:hypothetical protein